MNEMNYSELLRALSKEYCQGYVNFEGYRERRKPILDGIDFEYNGAQGSVDLINDSEQLPSSEDDEGTLFGKVFKLFKQDNEPE